MLCIGSSICSLWSALWACTVVIVVPALLRGYVFRLCRPSCQCKNKIKRRTARK